MCIYIYIYIHTYYIHASMLCAHDGGSITHVTTMIR